MQKLGILLGAHLTVKNKWCHLGINQTNYFMHRRMGASPFPPYPSLLKFMLLIHLNPAIRL